MSYTMDLNSGSFHPLKTVVESGNAAGDYFGYSVSNAGDINKDGYDDIIVGAYGKNNCRGAVYVIYGGETSSLPDITLATQTLYPASTGFMITGNADWDYLGYSVSKAGDIDNDGYDDIIIGANAKNSNQGAAYVIYGGEKSAMTNIALATQILNPLTTGFKITGNAAGDLLGRSVSSAGDINKDGYDDIIVGAYGKNSYQGAAYVIYGGPRFSMANWDFSQGATLTPSTTGFLITGNAVDDYFGFSVSTAGDINNDEYDDIIVGAYVKNSNQGAAYVIYGGAKSSMPNLDLSSSGVLNPSTTGFMITGGVKSRLGSSVSSAGDIDNDGYDDIIIGAFGTNSYQGAVYVIYGGPKSSLSNMALGSTTLDPLKTGFMITGNAVSDRFGYSVSDAGDVNNDGFGDVIIGAYAKNSLQGTAYLIYGGEKLSKSNIDLTSQTLDSSTTGITITGNAIGNYFGYSVSGGGDINKDGYDDFMIGAYMGSSNLGATYLILYPYDCPPNCETCDSPSSCVACKTSYFFYQGGCYSNCPSKTFASSAGDTCEDCPNGCSVCFTGSTCQTCLDGYTRTTELRCQKNVQVEVTEIEEKGGEKAAAGAFEGVSLVGASLSSGSSLPLNFGLVSKILRNFKYMALPVSRELQETFVSWKVASGFMSAPDSWSEKYSSKGLPGVFSRYGLQSAFLISFTAPL